MSKFHKTTYSRQYNFNAVSSSHGRRTAAYEQTNLNWGFANKIDQPIEKKIDIEPSLLFTHKNYQKINSKPSENVNKPAANKSEAKFYETSIGFTNAKDRPQSKQEPRPRGKVEGKLKTEVFHPDRPQTSKGVRACRGNEARERQISQNDEQLPIQVRVSDKKERNIHSSYSRKPTNQSNIMAFQTSIDPEFLSLFAN